MLVLLQWGLAILNTLVAELLEVIPGYFRMFFLSQELEATQYLLCGTRVDKAFRDAQLKAQPEQRQPGHTLSLWGLIYCQPWGSPAFPDLPDGS